MTFASVSIALAGSGGAGVMTAGQILLNAAAKIGYYGLMGRSLGPQIRGGESAALLRLATRPVQRLDDAFNILLAYDWNNIERFLAELPLTPASLVVCDTAGAEVPGSIVASGARIIRLPLTDIAMAIPGGRTNMVGLGIATALIGLASASVRVGVIDSLQGKNETDRQAALAAVNAGLTVAVEAAALSPKLAPSISVSDRRWNLTGNEATGLGALRGGVRFAAAYPFTPATDILEWLAPSLPKVGGILVQAEDELASLAMCLGASFGGVPSLTATSGPGLALMSEQVGLAVAAELPVVIVDVQRGGPSTGIPTKSEQGDLNLAVFGMHGDVPHLVLAASSITDCLYTTEWAVHLAESLQTPVIVLSDQTLGQGRAIIDSPLPRIFTGHRRVVEAPLVGYNRYAITEDGISPMTLPGTAGGTYTADGLGHSPHGTPSTRADHPPPGTTR